MASTFTTEAGYNQPDGRALPVIRAAVARTARMTSAALTAHTLAGSWT